jgi:DNA-binding response OmpR family regulator
MTSSAQLIVISPDSAVLQIAERCARSLGYELLLARDVGQAQRLLARSRLDLICFDSLVPADQAQQFWQLANCASASSAELPVLFFASARTRLAPSTLPSFYRRDRDGLVAKPLDVEALAGEVARLLASRSRAAGTGALRVGEMVLDGAKQRLLLSGNAALPLTPTEFRLLHCLMVRAGDFVSAEDLLEEVWGYPRGTGGPEIVRAHVSNLRRKLRGAGQDPQLLRTLPYRGYGFVAAP